MSGPAPTTSSIVARHGIAWMGGGSGGEVYGCACGNRATGTEGEPFAAAHFRHVAELVEQAALAPIRAALDGHPVCDVHPDDDTRHDARTIRRRLGGDGLSVYVCHISGAWHLGHPQPGKSRDDYRKEAR